MNSDIAVHCSGPLTSFEAHHPELLVEDTYLMEVRDQQGLDAYLATEL